MQGRIFKSQCTELVAMQRGKSAVFKIKVHIPAATMTWMSTLIWTFSFSNFMSTYSVPGSGTDGARAKEVGLFAERLQAGGVRATLMRVASALIITGGRDPRRNGKVNPEGGRAV